MNRYTMQDKELMAEIEMLNRMKMLEREDNIFGGPVPSMGDRKLQAKRKWETDQMAKMYGWDNLIFDHDIGEYKLKPGMEHLIMSHRKPRYMQEETLMTPPSRPMGESQPSPFVGGVTSGPGYTTGPGVTTGPGYTTGPGVMGGSSIPGQAAPKRPASPLSQLLGLGPA